ncbi:hypothetical protein VNO78_18274 [Psophocarpus tetragonolobus]|uniref:Uncharacterized protein n=1 Tax=Psophocarpus tetragonolobus TaxID=3891 RepID=A0AAN9XLC5_PSOTE
MHPCVEDIVVPRSLEYLSRDDAPELQVYYIQLVSSTSSIHLTPFLSILQLGSLLVLTSLSSGTHDHRRILLQQGALPLLLKLLTSDTRDDIMQEVYSSWNMADSPYYRLRLLDLGALMPILNLLKSPHSRFSLFKIATFCLSNLVRGKPRVNFVQVKPALPVLQQLLHSTNEEVVIDACWALSYLLDGQIDIAEDLTEEGVCPKLMELLNRPSETVILPALVALGNIAAGFIAQTQAVIEANIIQILVHALHHDDFDVQKAATRAIFNFTCRGSTFHIRYLAAQGCIRPLCKLLTCSDPVLLSNCLQVLDSFMSVGEADKNMGLHDGINVFAQMVEKHQGCNNMERLVKLVHGHVQNFYLALKILKRYWPRRFYSLFDIGQGW